MNGLLPLCGQSGISSNTLHLVLCPFAGASASAFRSWRDLNPDSIRVSLVVYPGRDQRMGEVCLTNIGELAVMVQETIEANEIPAQQLIVAGHSMGAQVAYEVCAGLEHKGILPRGLVLSACHAPHLRGRRPISHLDDRAFLTQLVAIGGCAPELLHDATLWPVFMPMLRADFRATEGYWHAPSSVPAERLQTPALLVHGSADEEAWESEVAAWETWLCNVQGLVSIAGDHFYITRRPRAFLEHIKRRFESHLAHAACL